MAKNTEATMKYKADISELKSSIQSANREIKLANAQFKAGTTGMKDWSSSADGLSAKQKQLTSVISAQKQKLTDLEKQYALVCENQGENSKMAQDLAVKIEKQKSTVMASEQAMEKFNKKLIDAKNSGKITAEEFDRLASAQSKEAAESLKAAQKAEHTTKKLSELKEVSGELTTRIGKGLVTALKAGTAAMGAMIIASTKVGVEFEAGMSEVQGISKASAEDMELLSAKAKEMGAKTKFSASEAAEAFKYMAMAGWKTQDMLAGIDGIMQLAAASGEDLATVSDIVTDGLTAFGLSAKDSGHFADVLAAASSSANTNVSMMGESFKEAAALSGTMKYSIDDMSVAIGLMANSGIKGSKAGTTLKNAIANMAKPTDAMREIMDKYNLSLSNADGTMKPFATVVEDLRKAFGGLTKDQQASAAATLFGKESMAGMLSVINASESDYNKLKTAIKNADGASKEMADTMQNNVKGSATILKSTLEGLGIQMYDVFKDDLKKGIDSVTKEFSKLAKELSKPNIKNALASVVKGLSSFLQAGLKVVTTIIPPLIEGFAFLAKNADKLIPLITGLAGAFLVYQTKTSIATKATGELNAIQLVAKAGLLAYNTVMGVLNGTMDIQIIKTKALNLLHSASPWGLVALAIGGVVAALLAFNNHEDEATKKLRENADEAKENREAWDEMSKAKQMAMQDGAAEIDYYMRLKDELSSLVDVNGNVKKGYEGRAKFIVGELNEAMGTEISMTGNVIDNYKEQMKALDDLMAKQRAKTIIDAGAEAYSTAIKNQTKALQEQKEAEKEVVDQKAKLQKSVNKLMEEGLTNEQAWYAVRAGAAGEDLVLAEETYAEKKRLAEGYTETIAEQEMLQKLYAQGNAEDIAAINAYISRSYDDKGKKVVLSTQEQVANEETLLSYLKQRYKDTGDQMYQDQITASENRLKKLKDDVKNQKSTVEEGTEGFRTAWENMTKQGNSGFEKGSDNYKVAALNQVMMAKLGITKNTKETTGAWKYLAAQGLAAFDDKAKQWKFTEAGELYALGAKAGIQNKQGDVWGAVSGMAGGMITAMYKALDIHSPSRKAYKGGDYFGLGLVNALRDRIPSIKKVIGEITSVMVDGTSAIAPQLNDNMSMAISGMQKSTVVKAQPSMTSQQPQGTTGTQWTLNQYNYSPKALSQREIYRNTNRALRFKDLMGGGRR